MSVTRISTTQLVDDQSRIGKSIEDAMVKHPKGAVRRDRMPAVLRQLVGLDQSWVQFLRNHEELVTRSDIDGGHEYFKENYRSTVEKMVAGYTELISSTMYQSSGVDPQYDLIHRGAIGMNPMFTEDGAPVAERTSSGVREENIFNPSSERDPLWQTLSNNGSNGASSGQKPTTNQPTEPPEINSEMGDIVLPSIRDFINTSSENMKSSSGVANLLNAIRATTKASTEFQRIPTGQDDQKKLKYSAQQLIRRWLQVVRMHERLSSTELDHYNANIYYDFEDDIKPILDQAYDVVDTTEEYETRRVKKEKSIKMPQLEIPKFNGDYTKWAVFKDLFDQMIEQRDLSNAEKFMYLRANLSGDALDLVKSLRVTAENYELAWDLLDDRYNNQRQIIKLMLNKMFTMEKAKGNSSFSLKKVHDQFRENMYAVRIAAKDAEELNDMIFHQLFLNKLDSATHTLYEQDLDDDKTPTSTGGLLKFVSKRFRALEFSSDNQPQKSNAQQPQHQNKKSTVLSTTQTNQRSCECKENHPLHKCPAFLALNTNERYRKVKNANRCINCFKFDHLSKECKAKKCQKCDKVHHTLLHFEKKTALMGSAIGNPNFQHVFLGTAIVNVENQFGAPIKVRALLDSGAQVSIISEKVFKKTGLTSSATNMTISGVGNATAKATKCTTITISSDHSNYNANLEVFIMKQVTSVQPIKQVVIDNWTIPQSLQLADPTFNTPAAVDLLIGGELFYRLLANGLINIGEGLPDLQNTVFGWVVIGKLLGLQSNKSFVGVGMVQEPGLDEQLTKFWKIEEKTTPKEPLSDKELACERYYENTTTRQMDGRFVVKLQFTKEPALLGSSKDMAIRRFMHLEKRFSRDQQLQAEYIKFMQEYIELGHMERIEPSEIKHGEHYVIPHHSVLNPSSSTTKFRVVFDASAKTTNQTSLNEILANGPMLQDDLFSIMIRFRLHKYVFSSDVGKMYRQILVAPEDQKWQLVVWRDSPESELKYYKLKTLTYGTTCASYLAIKTLQHLADIEQKNFPLASVVAKRDFNVDDVMTGTNDLLEAVQCQQQLVDMLKKAGMQLHKWCANHPMLLENIPKNKQEVSLDINTEKTETKALGMKWIPKTDIFALHYNPKEHQQITKRTVLSETAQLFDPLGLVNPVIVKAKIFIQELWLKQLDWDELLPEELQEKWANYRTELAALAQITIPRHAIIPEAVHIELHAFSDASERAFGAAIYLRSISENGEIASHLLCSKSRVAPVNQISLPRLELCGAVTMVELVKKLKSTMNIKFNKVFFWTDSEIVLSWLYTDATYKTFVANRVSKIKRNTDISDWRYVDTKNNPADIVSRGCTTNELKNSTLWWNGPEFLKKDQSEWPEIKAAFKREESEEKIVKTILISTPANHIISQINHRNSITTLQRIVAYCIKFGTKGQTSDYKPLGNLSHEHLKRAMVEILKYCQEAEFQEDIQYIKNGTPDKTRFKTMTPIIDADGVLRVGGRLQEATMTFEQKHPAILPYNHEVTTLIMQRVHLENYHAGPQAVLAITRQTYWPLKGKVLAKSVVDSCVLCSRAKPQLFEQVMGNLPKDRVTISRPFLISGVDFAGPITIHHKGRGHRTTKAYICLFVCFSTKAVHIEVATDLSTQAFLSCLKRFIARRGIVQRMYSDNATNFAGANKQLIELADLMESADHKKKVTQYCNDHRIEWRFIPPRSPHFGGLWESAIKSAKHLLTRVLHNQNMTYDELATVLTEIEAILNSRPLSPLSDDPNDLQPLTAGHFLIGGPLTAINDNNVPASSKTQQWAKQVQVKKEFWQRWTKEYLSELQYKNKWRATSPNVKIGTMVILKDINLPPLMWRLGRIISLMPDKDGIVRVVIVKTSTGEFRRAIHELAPLPVEFNEDQISTENLAVQAKVNPEAPEVEWKLNQPKPEIEAVNKKVIVKAAKKVERKKKQKPTVVIPDISPSRTRSGRQIRPVNLVTILMVTFFAMLAGAMGIPCNTTTFQSNPGLFFENTGQLSLSNDAWMIVCHMRMNEYWQQSKTVEVMIRHLKTVCPEVHPEDHCEMTIDQLEHQLKRINDKNELIRAFSSDKQSRRQRDVPTNFSDNPTQQKNGGRVSRKNLDEFKTKGKTLNRQKRGWFDIGGKAAKEVFGIMNDDDAAHYNEEIKSLRANENYLQSLIKNQTLIQEITSNVIRKDEAKVLKQILYLNASIANLQGKDSIGKMHLFNTISLEALSMMISYRETQDAVINMLTSVFHGKIPPTVITPSQLKKQLEIIDENISNDLMIPGKEQKQHISQLYTMLSAKVRVTSENLIIKIEVPLISREFYQLYHIVPVPFEHQGQLQTIVPSTEFIGINLKQDHYYMLSEDEKRTCKCYEDGLLICKQIQPLFNVQSGHTQCEMAVMLQPKTAHEHCNIEKVDKQQVWTALSEDNSYLFTVKDPVEATIICNSRTTHCTLQNSGLIQLPQQCIIKSGTMEISARNIMTGQTSSIMLVQPINITDHMPQRQVVPENHNIENMEDFENNDDLQALMNAIAQQKIDVDKNLIDVHDIHHYAVSYTILALFITAVIIFFLRKRLQQMCCGPNTSNMQQNPIAAEKEFQVIDLQHQPTQPIPTARFARPKILEGFTA